jgi:hypothetical protein
MARSIFRKPNLIYPFSAGRYIWGFQVAGTAVLEYKNLRRERH